MDKWKFDDRAEVQFKNILDIYSPSSREMQLASYIRQKWELLNKVNVKTDVLGNVYGTLNPQNDLTIALVAHLDTVCIQITKVLENGHLLFRRVGTQLYSLIGKRVMVITKNDKVEGVVGFDPLIRNVPEQGLVDDDLWIDIGTESKEESLSLVSIGDFAAYRSHYERMKGHKICSAGLDNRIGLFIILETLNWFAVHGTNLSICAIGSVQEEIGLRGAQVLGNNVKMDACIIVDVDYATDIPTSRDKMIGSLQLGKGAGICKRADNNIVLQSLIMDVADEKEFPYQVNLGRNIHGGTDGDVIQLQLSGIATANVSIPCRYMHSSNEICDIRDVESVTNILISCIQKIEQQNKKSFIPGID